MSMISPLTAATDLATQATTPASSRSNPLADESTFLTLLVSQLKNQDPLNPTDSTQFVSQLTAYSQLEQLIGINKNTATTTPPANGTNNAVTGS